ncbi:UDP-N-acetylglucosamine 2-epimerase (non-hydrolyzing) [bacterium]|nr:UDP-N-acetylglucosamine 2-epimerase (non-hydrolyzing) [bacterium]
MTPRKLLFLFGTRPEAIKLAPVILAARERPEFHVTIVVTAQHREMLDEVLRAFDIVPDRDLNIMAPGQTLFHVTSRVFEAMESVLAEYDPDVVLVQGDTTTVFAGAVAAFYAGKPVAHVEAGLRTGDLAAPFPEEANRKMASCVTHWHFAPTDSARQNLLREGYPGSAIHVTGNTVIDALLWMVERVKTAACPVAEIAPAIDAHERMVLITGHRRENFGAPFARICETFRRLAEENLETLFVYPVHLNPNVQRPVNDILGGVGNFRLLSPLAYPDFVWFMQRAHLIITDSGGVQEEAPALGKPVLVTRRVTERPEAVDAGVVKLVGDDPHSIFAEATRLLRDPEAHTQMARGVSPYGDGKASARILDVLATQ